MKLRTNPFTHLQGSLIRVKPEAEEYFFKRGIQESAFTALLVETSPRSTSGGSFKSLFLYRGSLYEFYLYPSEVSALL
jgi:hypothetical protein